jgi:AAA+ superfamily predicted ATPase
VNKNNIVFLWRLKIIEMLPKKLIKEDRFEREIEYKLSEKEICKTFLKEYNKKNKKDYLTDANQMFCDSLNERINSKNEKEYNYTGKLFLIIEEGIGLTEKEAVEYYINQGKKFTNNIFNEIWLMLQSAGHYKIYLLDEK